MFDEYQIMVDPVVLGAGTKIFGSFTRKPDLKLKTERRFKSGVALLGYEPDGIA